MLYGSNNLNKNPGLFWGFLHWFSNKSIKKKKQKCQADSSLARRSHISMLYIQNKHTKKQQCLCWIVLPSCTAWNGLFPSTNSTEMVIFSVSRISLFKLRSATARRNTSSSFRADSSKMAPVDGSGRDRTRSSAWNTASSAGNASQVCDKKVKPESTGIISREKKSW